MKRRIDWKRVMYFLGVIALVVGVLDPLEGSVLIAGGSALVTLSAYLTREKHCRMFLASMIMIIIGVFFLFYFSSLGGFGGTSTLSWWWGLLIIPYPVGWIISMVLIIRRAIR